VARARASSFLKAAEELDWMQFGGRRRPPNCIFNIHEQLIDSSILHGYNLTLTPIGQICTFLTETEPFLDDLEHPSSFIAQNSLVNRRQRQSWQTVIRIS